MSPARIQKKQQRDKQISMDTINKATSTLFPREIMANKNNPRTEYENVSEYDQEIPQSHTADQTTAPLGRATEA